jgi:D-alanyl-D-alanine carboxypeptidase/D-alanyl-D-alanine-endopeptidase (penicillin-binding protein 4)
MKKLLFIPLLILFFPMHSGPALLSASLKSAAAPLAHAEVRTLQAFEQYKEDLSRRGHDLEMQGIVIERLDGKAILAEHNAEITFNPASVMKLATSLVAITNFGPDHRYRTNFLAGGAINTATRKLEGDLVVEGGTDPMFSAEDAQEVASELSRRGIGQVTGSLRIAGPFYYYARGYTSNLSRETSANKLKTALERAGIRISGPPIFGEATGTLILSHDSDPLRQLLLYQNAYSSNAVAEVIGESVGGPYAVQEFLVDQLGIRESDIYVGHTSGLDFNRITPRASLKVLRGLIAVCESSGMKIEDVMPVAGIDSGTLRARLARDDVRGAVVAKTGTLVSFDNGVSTLVGIANTKRGPVLFAIFNSIGSVFGYRKLQDEFLGEIIEESGGAQPVARTHNALAEDEGDENSNEAGESQEAGDKTAAKKSDKQASVKKSPAKKSSEKPAGRAASKRGTKK